MKSRFLTLLIFLIGLNPAFARESLSDSDKLAATAKIWGFLKYYHPNVAKGEFDWDDQLLKILPSIEQATTKEELSSIFLKWIDSLGYVRLCKKCDDSNNEAAYFDKNFDLGWMYRNELFTEQLSEKLRFIEQNRFQGKHYYVTTKGDPQVLTFTNEKSYPQFDWTNKESRLLSLFRYWNTIEYFYPHKYQIDKNWDEVLIQMLPKFFSPDSETDYHLAMLELVVSLDDSHGYFSTDIIQQHFGKRQIPAAFTIIENKVVITYLYDDSLAQMNDLKVGDVISKVGNLDVGELFGQRLKYIYGANEDAKRKYSFNKILHGSTDSINVEINRLEQKATRNMARYTFDQFQSSSFETKTWKIVDNNIGYINLGKVNKEDLLQALEKLTNTRSMILDLRNYPKEFFGYILRNFFGAKNTMVGKQLNVDLQYPGRYILTEQNFNKVESKYKGQVIVLVNENTQSRAEYTAMWIQNGDNVTTIGSQTAGAGGVMIKLDFVGGFSSYFTSTGIFYPDMAPIQRKGVKIDREFKPTIQCIAAGKDEVLEEAIELLNSFQ